MLQHTPALTSPPDRARAPAASLRETLTVAILALLSLALHGHYRVPGLGESDAARFARLAFAWHLRGKLAFDEAGYQVRTSALYIQLEKVALDHHVALHSLPALINWVSVFLGTGCSVAWYVLCRKLTTRPVAAGAALIFTLTPGFWLGNIYGMPTIPGLFFLFLALIAFLDASRVERSKFGFYVRVACAWLFMSLAMMLKSDLVLCGGGFLGVALIARSRRWLLVGCAVGVVVGATVSSIGYARLVIAPAAAATSAGGGVVTFLQKWNQAFAINFDALLTDSNNTTISRCVGGLLFSVIVLALCFGLVMGGKARKQALLALLWGLPPILAWGVRLGNSARHNVPAFPPLILCTTLFLFEICRHDTRRAFLLIAGVLCASYWSNTSGEHALRPQSNLLALSEVMNKFTRAMHQKARDLAENPAQKRVLLGGYADSYAEFELLSAAKDPRIEIGDHWLLLDGDRITVIDYPEHSSVRQVARRYRRDGFEVLSMSYHF